MFFNSPRQRSDSSIQRGNAALRILSNQRCIRATPKCNLRSAGQGGRSQPGPAQERRDSGASGHDYDADGRRDHQALSERTQTFCAPVFALSRGLEDRLIPAVHDVGGGQTVWID